MEQWKEYQLKDVTTILGDGLHGTPEYDENGTVFFINGNNLVDGKIEIKDSTKRVSEEEANKYRKNLTQRTIFVSINGTFMEQWKEYKISEIIEEIAMGPFGSNIKVDNFIDSGIPVRLPLSGCFIRKLAGAGGRVAVVARCSFGGLSGHSGIWARERYLFPDRSGNPDRFGGEERYLDRRVRQGTGG